MKRAMDGVDVVFSDCNSVLSSGNVLGVSGFEMVADTAFTFGAPLYVCAPSWKIDSRTLLGVDSVGHVGRLWNKAPQGIKINDNLFDAVDSRFITGIISEFGIYAPQAFIEEAKYEDVWGL